MCSWAETQRPRPVISLSIRISSFALVRHRDTGDNTSLAEVLVVRVNQCTRALSYQPRQIGSSQYQIPRVLGGREGSFCDTTLPGPSPGMVPKSLCQVLSMGLAEQPSAGGFRVRFCLGLGLGLRLLLVSTQYEVKLARLHSCVVNW